MMVEEAALIMMRRSRRKRKMAVLVWMDRFPLRSVLYNLYNLDHGYGHANTGDDGHS